MLITKILARKGQYEGYFHDFEYLELSWEEMRKRRLHSQTAQGRIVDLAFEEGNCLQDGDLLAAEGDKAIIIKLAPERVFVIKPETVTQFGLVCYELGNRHLPVWLGDGEIMTIYDPVLKPLLFQHKLAFTEEERILAGPHLIMLGGGISHQHHHQAESNG